MTHAVSVLVSDLLLWARLIDDEIDLDGVSAALRAAAACPTGDLDDVVGRVRAAGVATGCGCHGRFRCSYHEGWGDALDRIEEELV